LPSLHAVESEPPDADRLRATIDDADSVALGTPNYHGSYAGSLKDAPTTVVAREFAGTTVGLLEVAGGEFPDRRSHISGPSAGRCTRGRCRPMLLSRTPAR